MSDILIELLNKAIKINKWILEDIKRVEGAVDNWQLTINKINEQFELADIDDLKESDFELINEYERYTDLILDYLQKREIVYRIKASILEERLK